MGSTEFAGVSIRESTDFARIPIVTESESSSTFYHFFIFLLFSSSASFDALSDTRSTTAGDVGITGFVIFSFATEFDDALAGTTFELGWNACRSTDASYDDQDGRSSADADSSSSDRSDIRSA